MTLYEDLQYRGLIKDQAGDDLEKIINGCDATFYWGTDPTADSLHIGHYSSLITVKRLAKAGHHPILLVGGATGLIGDPRPTAEREIISKETVQKNFEGIKKQVTDIFNGNVEVVNNYDWTKDINILDFLRDVGKYINVSYMLNKDIIARRLESGITFAEFTYTLLQGYDFLHLYQEKNCITTGIELINKKLGKNAYAFTMPLILDANGEKFGKSAGNALWLDKDKTPSYEFYQYLINTDDSKVEEYLKVFTFLTKEEIEEVMKKHTEKPEERLAQKTLAREFITDLHGKDEFEKAQKMSEVLFSGDVSRLSADEIEVCFKGVPNFEIQGGISLIDTLVNNKVCSSRREVREFLSNGSILINGKKVSDENMVMDKNVAIEEKFIVIRRGKKKYYLVRLS